MKHRAWGTAVLLSCAALAQNLGYQPDPEWRAPAAAPQPNSLASKPAAAKGGRKLFLRNCSQCHGAQGTGIVEKHSADLRLPVVQQQSDGTLYWKISNGNSSRRMPSFSKLPSLERWQLILFLRTLKPLSTPDAGESKMQSN